MKFPVVLLSAALYLFSSVEAGISTNTPFKSVTWNGGDTEKVVWVDDGKEPKLTELGNISIDLMAGGSVNQVLVANIGKVPAAKGNIEYKVPKDVGPPGPFYFIKYTPESGEETFFSGSFSIAKVNGKITGFDPKNPNVADPTAVPGAVPAAPGTVPPTVPPPTAPNVAPKANNTPVAPPTTPTVPAAPVSTNTPPSSNTLPNSLSSSAASNFPSFAGVATVAVAFAFTYLY